MDTKRNSRGPFPDSRRKSGGYRPGPGAARRQAAAGPGAQDSSPRRRAELRRRRRKRALAVFYVFLFVSVIAAAVTVSLTVLFKIDRIEVEGKTRYTAADIVRESGIRQGENLFLARTKTAQERIRKAFPYIGTVGVHRRFPARIVINVVEESVSGAAENGGTYVIVGTSGRVLETADKLPQNVPVILGLKLSAVKPGEKISFQDSAQKTSFESLTKALVQSGLKKITKIDLTRPYRLEIVYDGRLTMNLGLPADLEKKLRFAKNILDAGKIKETEKGTMDLSTAADDDRAYFNPDYSAGSSGAAPASSGAGPSAGSASGPEQSG